MTAALATDRSPAAGTPVAAEFVGRHADDGLIAHWAPNSTHAYYMHTTCALVLSSEHQIPFAAGMAVCPACFTPEQACVWCHTHCGPRLRTDHRHLAHASAIADRPTRLPDGTLRPAPALLRFLDAPVAGLVAA